MQNDSTVTSKEFSALRHHLTEAGQITIELVSNSMAPVLPTGTIATIEPVGFDDLRALDFIVYFERGSLICHTVWERGYFPAANGERTMITRGLSNPFFDEPVRESAILGRVTSHRITKFRFTLLSLKVFLLSKLSQRRNQRRK